jgi:hypothetical protein
MKKLWYYIPFIGGGLCIFIDNDFYHKNKIWYVPYHWVTGWFLMIFIIALMAKYGYLNSICL